MTVSINPKTIVWSEFSCLEPSEPGWLDQREYWEDYNRRFFQSNGLPYSESDSNVDNWLRAPDRAPFAYMVRDLLPQLREKIDLDGIEFVLLAHWLPDLHLGTSVTNFALHSLGLVDGFGFAISDRGRSAPLFGLHLIDQYLKAGRKRTLLMVMDQKHLLYRSAHLEALEPANSACLMVVERSDNPTLMYRGYARRNDVRTCEIEAEIASLCRQFSLSPDRLRLIGDAEVLKAAQRHASGIAHDRRLLCAAPFVALASSFEPGADYLLLDYEDRSLSAVGLSGYRSQIQ